MKVLFIGNSFSDDTTRYLERVAGGELFVRNLYIGGCSLEMHINNIRECRADYCYRTDAEGEEHISINEALHREAWDVISVQQVSGGSGDYTTYEPYLGELLDYVRTQCPDARIMFNRTWAYEWDSTHSAFPKYNSDTDGMHRCILEASATAVENYSLELIPVGNAIALARALPMFDSRAGGRKITRDGFHLSLDYGRYLAALTAYAAITGNYAADTDYLPEGVDAETARLFKVIADALTH